MNKAYDVPAVRHAVQLLEVLSESNTPLGVSEISRKLDLNKNMVFRLVNTFLEVGWIIQEEGPKYRMSLVPFRLASKQVDRLSIVDIASEPTKKLWEKIGHSVYIAVLYDDSALYIQHHNSIQNVRVAGMIGGRYPLHCTAPGKILLAYAPEDYFSSLSQKGFDKYTSNTILDSVELNAHLESVRSKGYAMDQEEYGKGILCIAVPIFDYTGSVAAALGVSVSTVLYSMEKLIDEVGPLMIETGQLISRQMGYVGLIHKIYKADTERIEK